MKNVTVERIPPLIIFVLLPLLNWMLRAGAVKANVRNPRPCPNCATGRRCARRVPQRRSLHEIEFRAGKRRGRPPQHNAVAFPEARFSERERKCAGRSF